MNYPIGFYTYATNVGIKDDSLDFSVIFSETICKASAVFTKNNFPGAPIIVGRDHIRDGKLQAIVINSKNSNVATGDKGIQDSRNICNAVAESLGIDPHLILPSSTGVIGVPLPMEKIIPVCKKVKENLVPGDWEKVARAIMTTDTKEKIASREYTSQGKKGVFYGIAKGAGMIEPNMATMLSYIVTDFEPESDLYPILKRSVDKSFNCLSIDSDTSTSDTVVLLASGVQGKIPDMEFEDILTDICIELTKKIARDGEGATKLVLLEIAKAKDENQARKIGKSILNSPLIKTAIYGGDPNWGRFIMAIGKVFDEPIEYDGLEIKIGDISVKNADNKTKELLAKYLKKNEEIRIVCELGTGQYRMDFFGCDLTEEYVAENAYYTT